jgi:adenylate cyclase
MREALHDYDGTIDKFMGDGILAFFNAPLTVEKHETSACHAALKAQERLAIDRVRRGAEGRPEFHTRIGLGVGEVIVGNIGTPDRFAYTVIGDAVNLASRLEGLNKFYGTSIIASGELVESVEDYFEWRRLDRVSVAGRTGGTDVFELMGHKDSVDPDLLAKRDAYEVALEAYFAGDFTSAAKRFSELSRLVSNDDATVVMARRARKLARRPPADIEWTGVYDHTKK